MARKGDVFEDVMDPDYAWSKMKVRNKLYVLSRALSS